MADSLARRREFRVGVDIGGTFTDLVVVEGERTVLWKQDTTPSRPEEGVQTGLESVAAHLGLELPDFLSQVRLFVHGSTVGTNMVIQRSGPSVGLICTEGFRDVLYFRNGFKWDRFNRQLERPEDFVPRRLRVGVGERVTADGSVLEPLDDGSVREAAAVLREQGAEAVAVSLLWAQANPAHEERVRELLGEEMPGVPVVLSSEILPEIGEWVRTSATALSAYVYPGCKAYLERLERWLHEHGLDGDLLVMQVNGGSATVEGTLRVPVGIIHSGPAAAPASGLRVGQRLPAQDMITVDMGGTSFDVCLIKDGEVPRSRTIEVEHQPIGVPGVEIHSIGAGGGSIAWIDRGGALRVGPQSAGASPGPAAYDQGGALPTVTDANVVLGYLSPDAFLGGRRQLRADLAREAVRVHVAEPLGLDVTTAAAGVIRLVNESMVSAIGVVSVERGIDPRPFVLVAGGGAGALHAGRLAAELGMKRVLVPAEAGTLSAFGMTVSDVRYDYAHALHTTSTEPAVAEVAAALAAMDARAAAELAEAGFEGDRVRLQHWVDARYIDQVHELMVPVPAGAIGEDGFAAVAAAFHALHDERYGWSAPERAVEYLHWRTTGAGAIDLPVEARFGERELVDAGDARSGSRDAYFEELGGFVDTPSYAAELFTSGACLTGPALIDSATTTIVVFPGQRLTADGRGSFLIETD